MCGLGVVLFVTACGDDDASMDDAGRADAETASVWKTASMPGSRVDASVSDADLPDGQTGADLGTTCDVDSACASGSCVDGVCCENACEGTCASCLATDTGGEDGRCLPIREGFDPARRVR
ncbi:MAG: hypothetical protein R3B99_07690 [Polyangiales bacterium]